MAQFQACPSLKCKWWGRAFKQNPMVGLKNRVQMPHPGTTPKLYFPVNKLQIPCLWEASYNLIKTCEVPYTIRP